MKRCKKIQTDEMRRKVIKYLDIIIKFTNKLQLDQQKQKLTIKQIILLLNGLGCPSGVLFFPLLSQISYYFYIYFLQTMNKNINTGPKSWKSAQEGHKATSSMIVQNYYKFHNGTPPPIVPQIKNTPFNPTPKSNIIHRYHSEEDFRKCPPAHQDYMVELPTKVEDQYFPEIQSPTFKNGKKVRSIQKGGKYNPVRVGDKGKILPESINLKINQGLKQTSSTQSAQNLTGSKPLPAFMRSKLQKNSQTKSNEYFHQRLSTPRSNGVRRENFRIISKLGEGKFGLVFLVKQIYTGFILAMKIIEKKRIIQDNLLEQFIRQLRIQSFLNHQNIISLYGFFSDQTHFYTLMELGCDGQLYSLISNRRILSQEATSYIVKNLLQAIFYIHQNKVLHRDIKPENIVLIMGNVKICDFGWAVNKLHPGQLRNTFCGTPLYLSPQILDGKNYDQKVDLWAIGILAYELYLGCSPFDINDQSDLYKIKTESVKFPQDKQISGEFKEFIYAMLTKNPNERLTSKKLLGMSFITKYKDFETCQELCK